ncbi:MAG: High-affinity leucine-specific transport system, periplasmic binding protein LivK [Candidatus Gallionella acididurans]|uniref:High-affinity leucine-specific transport system, periplasmic binding protein LivK n=1 Tax=Candidatus Gallionella acididurans TaxID=1796491 RepID=A0A139BTY5_9PROT|nr:MAG: High-affinity leucine-specific transport system, periplasmic binding protein LivK [Candidatus Gallionella acididurans]
MRLLPAKLMRDAVPLIALLLAACGGGSGAANGTAPVPVAAYSVGGTLTGLTSGNSITLSNNGTDNLTLSGASGISQTFIFAAKLPNGAAYKLTLSTTSPNSVQPCTSIYGTGVINGADVPGINLPGMNVFCGQSNPSPTFTSAGSMNAARYNHTATLLQSGKVLVSGGQSTSFVALTSAELYDPSGSWAPTINSMNEPRRNHIAILLPNGKVLVSGGYGGVSSLTSAELYDPVSGTWTYTGQMNVPRQYHSATLLPNGKVLVSGGNNTLTSFALQSAELYDPVSGTWTYTGQLNVARQYHTATLLPNGKVLVAGGTGTAAAPGSAELYDPVTGKWSNTCNLTTGRYNHTATLLPNGTVLVSGGQQITTIVTATAELYDPAAACSGTSSNWTKTGSLNTARYYHTATLLQNGKVLVSGGNGGGAAGAINTAELYY